MEYMEYTYPHASLYDFAYDDDETERYDATWKFLDDLWEDENHLFDDIFEKDGFLYFDAIIEQFCDFIAPLYDDAHRAAVQDFLMLIL